MGAGIGWASHSAITPRAASNQVHQPIRVRGRSRTRGFQAWAASLHRPHHIGEQDGDLLAFADRSISQRRAKPQAVAEPAAWVRRSVPNTSDTTLVDSVI